MVVPCGLQRALHLPVRQPHPGQGRPRRSGSTPRVQWGHGARPPCHVFQVRQRDPCDLSGAHPSRTRAHRGRAEPGVGQRHDRVVDRDEQRGPPCPHHRRHAIVASAPQDLSRPLRRDRRGGPLGNPAPCNRKRDYLEGKSYNLVAALKKLKPEATRFATDLRVPMTNNLAERDVRMLKLHSKISSCFQSDDGARHFATIRSYISTARKHKVNALDALAMLFRGDAWMPPSTT